MDYSACKRERERERKREKEREERERLEEAHVFLLLRIARNEKKVKERKSQRLNIVFCDFEVV